MIHLEHAEGGIRIPIRERVEARAEDDVLPDSGGDRTCQRVLRHATPDRKERTQALRQAFGIVQPIDADHERAPGEAVQHAAHQR